MHRIRFETALASGAGLVLICHFIASLAAITVGSQAMAQPGAGLVPRTTTGDIFQFIPTQSHIGQAQVAGMVDNSMREVLLIAWTNMSPRERVKLGMTNFDPVGLIGSDGFLRPAVRDMMRPHLQPAAERWFTSGNRGNLDGVGVVAPNGQIGLGDGHHRLLTHAELIWRIANSAGGTEAEVHARARALGRSFEYRVQAVTPPYLPNTPTNREFRNVQFYTELSQRNSFFVNEAQRTEHGLVFPTADQPFPAGTMRRISEYLEGSHPQSFMRIARRGELAPRPMNNDPLRTAFGQLMREMEQGPESSRVRTGDFQNYVQFRGADRLRAMAATDRGARTAISRIEAHLNASPPRTIDAGAVLRQYLLDNALMPDRQGDSVLRTLLNDVRPNLAPDQITRLFGGMERLFDFDRARIDELKKMFPKIGGESTEAHMARLRQIMGQFQGLSVQQMTTDTPEAVRRAMRSGNWDAEKQAAWLRFRSLNLVRRNFQEQRILSVASTMRPGQGCHFMIDQ